MGAENIAELAKMMNITPSAIYQWVARDSIPVKRVKKIFNDVDLHYLATGEGSIVKDAVRAEDQANGYGAGGADQLAKARRLTADIEQQANALQGRPLPQDVHLELIRSAIMLLESYLKTAEALQQKQSSQSKPKPEPKPEPDKPPSDPGHGANK